MAHRAPVEFEIFSREYFLEAGKRMQDRHRYFVWRRGGKAIAFSFCTIWKDAIYDNDIGLDYDVAHDLNLYYVTFHDLIAWALAHGLKFYHCAPFNYDPKLHLRLQPVDVDLYVRHRSTIVNALLKWIAPLFAPGKSDPALQRYYGRTTDSRWKRFLKFFANPWLQLVLNIIIVTISELLLKMGARDTAQLSERLPWTGLTGLASPWTWLGIVCIIVSLVNWLYIPATRSAFDRLSTFQCRARSRAVELLDFFRRTNFNPALVRHCARSHRALHCGQAVRAHRRKTMKALPFVLIFGALITFVAGQLWFKRAMEMSHVSGFGRQFAKWFVPGICAMTVSFFITLGLLQRLDLSYVYPFQGLSVIIISVTAAFLLKEKLTLRLTIGALLISLGIVFVSLS